MVRENWFFWFMDRWCNERLSLQADLVSALRGSISFGRFLSESLDWEKWSAFSHNKHLEEAKNCSVPGSVAQKKAYFEAHYRRSASMKSAAVLEPEKYRATIGLSCHKAGNKDAEFNDSFFLKDEGDDLKNDGCFQTPFKFDNKCGLERIQGDNVSPDKQDEFHGKHYLQIKSLNRTQSIESEAIVSQNDGKVQEETTIKELFINSHQNEEHNENKSASLKVKSADINEESRISCYSGSKIQKPLTKENKPPQNRSEIYMRTSDRRKPASGSPLMPVSSNSIQSGQKPSLVNKILPFYNKVGCSKAASTPSRSSERHYSDIPRHARASTSGSKYTAPQLEHTRTQTPLYEASFVKRKVEAKFFPSSINCFKSPSARENKQLHAGSASSGCKTYEKIPATRPGSPTFSRSNSKSSAETPLMRSSSKRNKSRQMTAEKGQVPDRVQVFSSKHNQE